MGFLLIQACIDRDLPSLSDGEWRTLLAICRHADDTTGGNCHPSTMVLCKKSRLSEKVVRKAIQSLEANGWIQTSQAPGSMRFFIVNINKIMTCPPLDTEKVHHRAEVKGGVKVHPRVEVPENPVQFCTPTPCKSAPLREHIKEHEENNQSEDDSPFFLTPETPAANHADETLKTDDKPAQTQVSHPADAPAAKTKRKAITHELDLDALPDNWRAICEELRPDLNPEKVFAEFRFYWQQGRGQGTKRSDKGWTSTWLNWIKRQKEQRAPQFSAPAALPPALNPRQMFDDDYYAGCNNDELARVLAREEEMKNANR